MIAQNKKTSVVNGRFFAEVFLEPVAGDVEGGELRVYIEMDGKPDPPADRFAEALAAWVGMEPRPEYVTYVDGRLVDSFDEFAAAATGVQ